MAKDKNKLNDDREARLADALRANLRRRKEQARATRPSAGGEEDSQESAELQNSGYALPKGPEV